jgi:indole-3-glycerol phosphate synthase
MLPLSMNKLLEIIASKEAEWKRLEPLAADLRKQALLRNDFRPFRAALQLGNEVAVIAEVKKASPSAGIIAADFNPLSQAREYARGGAHALSVLTDEKYFQGRLSYLKQIREQVELPLLRKDFIVHELQVYESVVAGADAILLIAAGLEDANLRALYDLAKACQLDVLVEVHDLAEMDRALELGADMIGINNRNLKSFAVDLAIPKRARSSTGWWPPPRQATTRRSWQRVPLISGQSCQKPSSTHRPRSWPRALP